MKLKVEINIPASIDIAGTIKKDILIQGRLLGALNAIEATKVLQNEAVSSRIATIGTISLEDTLKGLETIQKSANGYYKFGSLLVAVSAIKIEDAKEFTQTFTRQLFISAPITLVSETKRDARNLLSATVTCKDDSLIIIKETIND